MKKTVLILALIALAVGAQSATIKWTIGGNTSYVINDVNGNPYANKTVYLIAGSDLSGLTNETQNKSAFEQALSALTIETATSSATGTKPSVTNLEVSHATLMTAGSSMSFTVLIVSEKDGFGYYKAMTTTGIPYADDAPAASRNARISTAWAATGIDKGNWTKAYSVPEPSTAALALAGLALLLKRRKA